MIDSSKNGQFKSQFKKFRKYRIEMIDLHVQKSEKQNDYLILLNLNAESYIFIITEKIKFLMTIIF